ncbi:MAG: phosphopantothenate/pantothenate synthetase [Thermoplasmata archaeon]
MTIPKSHPRYESLKKRERLIKFYKKGIVADAGLIAHGREEAFDYLLGEKTQAFALEAERAAVALMKISKSPVISVNGNVTALCAGDIVKLAHLLNAKIEVNLFYRTEKRIKLIEKEFIKYGYKIYGTVPDAKIPGIEHKRSLVFSGGIYIADTVLIPLEDGDRAKALKDMGKNIIAIDLNPLSRTAQTADITIVDELTRAIKEMIIISKKDENWNEIIKNYNNKKILSNALKFIKERLDSLSLL